MLQFAILSTLLVFVLALTPCRVRATAVTGGQLVMDLDAAALAGLNFGSNPAVGALILEEFFGGQDDASRNRTQIVNDHLVPGTGGIPATGLGYEINGATVTNLERRYSQPTNFQFNPLDVTGSATGGIGLRGVMRFVGDFDGIFVMGDFLFRYDAARRNAARSGWHFVNYLDNFRVPAFDTTGVTVSVKPGVLSVSGTMTISEQLANAFLNGEANKPVGTFRLTATLPGADFVAIETVPVGHAGNAPDTTGFGRVDYDYHIGTTEVTNRQYADFLNAVDPDGTNPHDVYNSNMSSDLTVSRGGIDFTGTAPAGTKYRPKPNYANKPVSYVSFYDAARFTNWLMTGDTERGFYTFSGLVSISREGPHGPAFGGNYVALPSEDEWYKAAYHKNDGLTANYFLYPTSSNAAPAIALSTAEGDIANPGPNVANYDFGATWNNAEGLGNVTTAGSAGPYSASPYGTLDQGGNQYEWNDTVISLNRGFRGGSLWRPLEDMRSTSRGDYYPETGGSSLAFRVVSLAPLIPPADASTLKLNGFEVTPGAAGPVVMRFLSQSSVEYRFEYTTDLRAWHRLHVPLAGNGLVQEIPVPPAVRAGGRCFVRAFLTYRGW